jgi:hypothetical protein
MFVSKEKNSNPTMSLSRIRLSPCRKTSYLLLSEVYLRVLIAGSERRASGQPVRAYAYCVLNNVTTRGCGNGNLKNQQSGGHSSHQSKRADITRLKGEGASADSHTSLEYSILLRPTIFYRGDDAFNAALCNHPTRHEDPSTTRTSESNTVPLPPPSVACWKRIGS